MKQCINTTKEKKKRRYIEVGLSSKSLIQGQVERYQSPERECIERVDVQLQLQSVILMVSLNAIALRKLARCSGEYYVDSLVNVSSTSKPFDRLVLKEDY